MTSLKMKSFTKKLSILCATSLLAFATTAASAQTTYIILKGKGGAAQLKATPESGASSNGSVPVGLVVKSAGGSNVDANGKRWLKVKYGGNIGWVEQNATFKVKGGDSSGSSSSSTETKIVETQAPKEDPKPVIETPTATSTTVETPSASVTVSAEPVQTENVFAKPKNTNARVFSTSNEDEIKKKLKAQQAKVASRKKAEKAKRNNLLKNTPARKVSNGDEYAVTDPVLYARAEPNQSYTPIMSLSQGQKVSWTGLEAVFSNGEVWWQIDSYGSLGWVPRSGLSGQQAQVTASVSTVRPLTQPVTPQPFNNNGTGSTFSGQRWGLSGVSGGLRLRAGPGTSFQALASIPSNYNDLVALGDIQGNWLKVQYGNWIGWVSLDYVAPR